MSRVYAELMKQLENIGGTRLDLHAWPRATTGIRNLDQLLEGWPRDCMIELYGEPNTGKSTLGHLITKHHILHREDRVLWVRQEEQSDDWPRKLGVPVDAVDDKGVPYLDAVSFESAEQALEFILTAIKAKWYQLIVIDTVAKMAPSAELKASMSDMQVGLMARLMAKFSRMSTDIMRNSNCTLLVLNQTRADIGVKYGDPKTTPGGNAMKFEAAVRIYTLGPEQTHYKSSDVTDDMSPRVRAMIKQKDKHLKHLIIRLKLKKTKVSNYDKSEIRVVLQHDLEDDTWWLNDGEMLFDLLKDELLLLNSKGEYHTSSGAYYLNVSKVDPDTGETWNDLVHLESSKDKVKAVLVEDETLASYAEAALKRTAVEETKGGDNAFRSVSNVDGNV